MEQYGDMLAGAGIIAYIVIGLAVLFFGWWVFRLIKGKKPKSEISDLPPDTSYESISADIKGGTSESGVKIGQGNIKCLCFRRIKGVNVADFTTITEPVGELYQFDPSCPVTGSGYIVKEDKNGVIVDYDPREIAFKVEESPERAWFAIHWDIVKAVFFVPIQWWKSTSVWFAAAMLVIVFVATLAVVG